jgi:hypothetical protein
VVEKRFCLTDSQAKPPGVSTCHPALIKWQAFSLPRSFPHI